MTVGQYGTKFLSLSPEEHPLPSCLQGSKGGITIGSSGRQRPALFPSKGVYYQGMWLAGHRKIWVFCDLWPLRLQFTLNELRRHS